jgi:hypothetical protein
MIYLFLRELGKNVGDILVIGFGRRFESALVHIYVNKLVTTIVITIWIPHLC